MKKPRARGQMITEQPLTFKVTRLIKNYIMIGNNFRHFTGWLLLILLISNCSNKEQGNFSTSYFEIKIDDKGFITSMKNNTLSPHREFSPADKPSPLMCLYDGEKQVYYKPIKAIFNEAENAITLDFSNGSALKVYNGVLTTPISPTFLVKSSALQETAANWSITPLECLPWMTTHWEALQKP